MARVMEHNRTMLQKMMHAVQEESLKFVNRRLEHTSDAHREQPPIAKRVSDLLAIQQEWILDFARGLCRAHQAFRGIDGRVGGGRIDEPHGGLVIRDQRNPRAATEATNGAPVRSWPTRAHKR